MTSSTFWKRLDEILSSTEFLDMFFLEISDLGCIFLEKYLWVEGVDYSTGLRQANLRSSAQVRSWRADYVKAT